jgi:hypothetical protein
MATYQPLEDLAAQTEPRAQALKTAPKIRGGGGEDDMVPNASLSEIRTF